MKVLVILEEIRGNIVSFEERKSLWEEKLTQDPGLSLEDISFVREEDWMKENQTGGRCYESVDAILGMKLKDGSLSEEFFRRYPKVKYVATFNHGFGNYDREAVKRHGVTVRNTVYGDVTVAQFAMGLLLNICHGITENRHFYKEEHFCESRMENHTDPGAGKETQKVKAKNPAPVTRQIELYKKTLGVIGLGSIGLWTARMAAGFGMRILAYSPHPKTGKAYDFIEQTSLEEVLRNSDVISLHCPLTEETRGLINAETISMMKDGVILINTARGDIIVEKDLADALRSRKIYAAGLDVVSGEPLAEKTEIFDCENAYITPHMAWLSKEAVYRQVEIAAENLRDYLIDSLC